MKIFPGTEQLHLPTVALNICISASEQINDNQWLHLDPGGSLVPPCSKQ